MSRFEALLDMLTRAVETSAANPTNNSSFQNECTGNFQLRSPTQTATTTHGHSVDIPSNIPSHNVLLPELTDPLAQREQEFQLGDLFDSQWNSWNFQLWPLAPVNEKIDCMNNDFSI